MSGPVMFFGDRNQPPPMLLAQALDYIARSTVTYAKTMPENPHWYVVRGRPRDIGHEALFHLIEDHFLRRRWRGCWYRSVDIEGWVWWIIEDGTVINTKPVVRAGWDDEEVPPPDWLPDEFRRNLTPDDRRELLTVLTAGHERFRWDIGDVRFMSPEGDQ